MQIYCFSAASQFPTVSDVAVPQNRLAAEDTKFDTILARIAASDGKFFEALDQIPQTVFGWVVYGAGLPGRPQTGKIGSAREKPGADQLKIRSHDGEIHV